MRILKIDLIRAEFARRAVQFHSNEKLENISLWGLFDWSFISKFIESGQIIPNAGFTKINKTIWCKPSQNEIDNYIKPLIEKHSLQQLTTMAGW